METAHTTTDEQLITRRKAKQRRVYKIIVTLTCLCLFFFLTTTYSFYQVYLLKKITTKDESAPSNPDQMIEAIGRHIMIPVDEKPQIAAIQDVDKLKTSQPFFKDAVNGDVVVVIGTKIVIYRPNADILVSVGDLTDTGTVK